MSEAPPPYKAGNVSTQITSTPRSTEEQLALCIETLNRLKGFLAGQNDPRNQKWIDLIKKALE